jgi:molybdopterin molybdotransferase
MISAAEALRLVLDAARRLPTEQRSMAEATGLVLAEAVGADQDQPPFDRAMMDGYAVPEDAAGLWLPIIDRVAAGQASALHLAHGQCAEIMTGAPCPSGTWAVVPKEHIQLDENGVLFPPQIKAGQNIAPKGSDRKHGEVILQEGDRIDALAIAVLASVGKTSVRVIRPARVAIITTGAEVVSPDSKLEAAQIRDANGPMLSAMARAATVENAVLEHATDEMDAIVDTVQRFADFDVLVLTGGVSAGRFDFVPDALRQGGAKIVFHKVLQKPGKPLLFAQQENQLIFGLPGHPLACHFSFHRYVLPAIRKMQGQQSNRPVLTGLLTQPVKRRTDRTAFVLGKVIESDDAARPSQIQPLPGRSTADVFRAVAPDCYLEIPTGTDPIPAGGSVRFTRLDPI